MTEERKETKKRINTVDDIRDKKFQDCIGKNEEKKLCKPLVTCVSS